MSFDPLINSISNMVNDELFPETSQAYDKGGYLIAVVKDKDGKQEVILEKGNFFSRLVIRLDLLLKYGFSGVEFGREKFIKNLTPHMNSVSNQAAADMKEIDPARVKQNAEHLGKAVEDLKKVAEIFSHSKERKSFDSSFIQLKDWAKTYKIAQDLVDLKECLDENGEVKSKEANTYARLASEIYQVDFDQVKNMPAETKATLKQMIVDACIPETCKRMGVDERLSPAEFYRLKNVGDLEWELTKENVTSMWQLIYDNKNAFEIKQALIAKDMNKVLELVKDTSGQTAASANFAKSPASLHALFNGFAGMDTSSLDEMLFTRGKSSDMVEKLKNAPPNLIKAFPEQFAILVAGIVAREREEKAEIGNTKLPENIQEGEKYLLAMQQLRSRADALDMLNRSELNEVARELRDEADTMHIRLQEHLKGMVDQAVEFTDKRLKDVNVQGREANAQLIEFNHQIGTRSDQLNALFMDPARVLDSLVAPNNLENNEKNLIVFLKELFQFGKEVGGDERLRAAAEKIGVQVGKSINPHDLLADIKVKEQLYLLNRKAESRGGDWSNAIPLEKRNELYTELYKGARRAVNGLLRENSETIDLKKLDSLDEKKSYQLMQLLSNNLLREPKNVIGAWLAPLAGKSQKEQAIHVIEQIMSNYQIVKEEQENEHMQKYKKMTEGQRAELVRNLQKTFPGIPNSSSREVLMAFAAKLQPEPARVFAQLLPKIVALNTVIERTTSGRLAEEFNTQAWAWKTLGLALNEISASSVNYQNAASINRSIEAKEGEYELLESKTRSLETGLEILKDKQEKLNHEFNEAFATELLGILSDPNINPQL